MYLFLVPSPSCPASCRYCNGPQGKTTIMSPDLGVEAIDWAFRLNRVMGERATLKVTFHGGEPLLARIEFYEKLFKGWHARSKGKVVFGLQSNLWLLTEDLCDLFARYDTSIGTSLDGPPEINDVWRGKGYYARTMKGVEIARRRSLPVSSIATFTRDAATRVEEVLTHFAEIGMDFSANGREKKGREKKGSALDL